ncbi:MAG: rRNA maturation RNase YbeY [Terriglobales bacterium]
MPSLRRFLKRAQLATGATGEVAVRLLDDAAIRRLNRQFRHHNYATDILSFPAGRISGDLAVSVDTAFRQARHYGHSLATELRILLLHGLLHLAGMDHERDHGEMHARELSLRSRFRLPSGLIERSH